jgi:L-amino acid N-acyltransferase YncA
MSKTNASAITIIPLSQNNIRKAILLTENIFPFETDQRNARFTLYDSLGDQEHGQRYWVAVNEQNKVIGITGLYEDRKDKTVIWLGWHGVHTEHRLYGIGSKLLDYAINEAKKAGYKKLRLFSSLSDPNEQAAHKLYKKFSFVQTGSSKTKDKIYFEKELNAVKADNGWGSN